MMLFRTSIARKRAPESNGIAAEAAHRQRVAGMGAAKKTLHTARHEAFLLEWIGGADGDRTHDLRIANATLSQLSYRPT